MKAFTRQPVLLILLAAGLILAGVTTARAVVAQRSEPPGADREGSEYITTHIRDLAPDQLPALQADGMAPLYHFSGVLNHPTDTPARGTAVQCTNLDATASTRIEVQLFNYDASAVDTGAITVGPLRTVTFESTSILFYMADVPMSAGEVEQGYGRILADHTNVICTVQVLDATNATPTWSMDIPVYRQGYGTMLPAIMRNATH